MTARTTFEWVKSMECDELLYGKRLLIKLKVAVDKSHIRPIILCKSGIWSLKEKDTENLQKGEINGDSNALSTAQNSKKS